MAKATRSRHRSRARKLETAPSQRQADVSSALAQRDLLAAILDAASENGDLEKYLSQVVAHLGQYSKCSCIGILLFEDAGIAGCTSCHGGATEFQRTSRSSFPGSETCICNAIAKLGSDTRPSYLTESGAFFRNSKPNTSARTETADGAFGICIGSIFESVALIPIRHPKTVMGFILVGDEGQDKIPLKTVKFLERVGTYVGSTVRSLEAQDKVRQSEHGLPGPAAKIATASHDSDEMELLVRLIENSNESIVISQDWRIIYVNNKCAEMAGLSKDDMIGLAFLDITHPDDRQAVKERYSRILNGEWFPTGTILRGLDKDGNTRWAELREIPFSWHGRPAVMSLVNDITDRKRAEEALAESERHYRFLADNTSDVIWVTDLNLKPSYLSPSVSNLTGYSVDEAMTATLEMRLTSASAKAASEAFADAFAREKQRPGSTKSRTIELELKCKDGSTVWVDTTVTFMRDSEGRAIGILGTMRDVTERRRAEEALKQSETKYKNLFEHTLLGMEVVDGQTGKTVLANRSLARMFGFKSPADMVGTNPLDYVPPEDTGWVVSQIAQLMADPTWAETAQIRAKTEDGRMIWLTGMGTPIEYEGRSAMLLSLVDMTAAKEAETKLHESEERYRLVVENANEAIVVLQDGLVKFTNPKGAELVGQSGGELTPTPFLEFIHPDDRQMMMDNHVRRLAGKDVPSSYTFRMIDKEGNTKWIQINAVLLDWEGKPAVLSLLNDITDRTRADEALKASEEKFRALAENSSDMIVLLNKSGVISYESPAAGRLLGLSPEARIGERPFERVHPEDLPKATDAFGQLMRNPGAGPGRIDELRLQHRDGSWRTMEATGSAIVRDGDVEGIVVTLHDVTERKNAEEALRASEERFRTLIEKATDAIAILDGNGKLLYESRSMERITGYRLEDWLGKPMGDWLLHPDDIAAIASTLERLLSHPEPTSEDIRVRFKHKDGSWHFLEGTVRNLLHDPSVNGIVVNYRDVTERKRAEEALQASEIRYRLLAENASDVIFTSDLAMKLTYVSPSVMQLTGYAPEETMSLNIDSWVAPASREFVLKSFSWALSKAKSGIDLPPALRTATLEMSKKDGGTVWAEIKIDFLRDEGGQPMGILGVARDITDRRIAEMELEHRVQLEMLITEISTAFIGISTDYMDQGIRNALESISGFTEVDRSYIFMFSEDRTRMDLVHEWCSKGTKPLVGRLNSVEVDSIPWLVAKVKQAECAHIPELADLPAAAEAERALFRRQGVRSMIVVPMVQAGNAIGFLGLGSIHGKKTWDEETIMLLRLVAEMFSNALERKRMDLALRESEKLYRLLAENITDVIWTTDMQTNITYMSPSATRLVGFSQEEYGR